MMERFWIDVASSSSPFVSRLGIGVTAGSENDARTIVADRFGAKVTISHVRVIKDMRSVDQHHVVPNMGNHFVRGIWFPNFGE